MSSRRSIIFCLLLLVYHKPLFSAEIDLGKIVKPSTCTVTSLCPNWATGKMEVTSGTCQNSDITILEDFVSDIHSSAPSLFETYHVETLALTGSGGMTLSQIQGLYNITPPTGTPPTPIQPLAEFTTATPGDLYVASCIGPIDNTTPSGNHTLTFSFTSDILEDENDPVEVEDTVYITLISPISISETQQMDFGKILKSTNSYNTATISTSGALTLSGPGDAQTLGSNLTAGEFLITAEANETIAIEAEFVNGGNSGMTLTNFIGNYNNQGDVSINLNNANTFSTVASGTLKVGATIGDAATQTGVITYSTPNGDQTLIYQISITYL